MNEAEIGYRIGRLQKMRGKHSHAYPVASTRCHYGPNNRPFSNAELPYLVRRLCSGLKDKTQVK